MLKREGPAEDLHDTFEGSPDFLPDAGIDLVGYAGLMLDLTDIVEATDHIVQSGRTLADALYVRRKFWALRQAFKEKVSNVVRSCSEGRAWGVPQ